MLSWAQRPTSHGAAVNGMTNPVWVRDEIILAMDLYMRAGRRQLLPSHEEVIRLSQLLNRLPIHSKSVRDENFRNPNFFGIDPVHNQPGLSRSNHLQAPFGRSSLKLLCSCIEQPRRLKPRYLSRRPKKVTRLSSRRTFSLEAKFSLVSMSFGKGTGQQLSPILTTSCVESAGLHASGARPTSLILMAS